MPDIGRQGTTFAERPDLPVADLGIELCGHFAQALLQPRDVGLLEIEELAQILHRTQKQRAGVCGVGSLSTHELALPLQREAVPTQRRHAVFKACLLAVELAAGLIEDRWRDGVVVDQLFVEVELLRKTKQLEIADTNGASDNRIAGLELQETIARGVRRRFRSGHSGLVVEPEGVASKPRDRRPDRDHPRISIKSTMLVNRAQLRPGAQHGEPLLGQRQAFRLGAPQISQPVDEIDADGA